MIAVVLDGRLAQKASSQWSLLVNNEVDVYLDNSHNKFINRTIIIDGFTIVAGKFNNYIEVLHNQSIADVYFNEWSKHVKHSVRIYSGIH